MQGQGSKHTPKEGLMGRDERPVVKGVYDACGRGDVPAVLAAMAHDVEWYEAEGMPYGGLHHGPDAAAKNVLGPLARDIPDFAAAP
jgi:ketosteroid isomerase-like protein